MTTEHIIILALATWYVSYAVTRTKGIGGMFTWLRDNVPLGGLTVCIICLSVWVAAFLGIAWIYAGEFARYAISFLAIAGAANMLGTYSGANHAN
jgi:Protein of unknown function (DUF1360)